VHLGNGWSVSQVAVALLVDEKTIYNWVERYQQGGTKELLALHYRGSESKLTETQLAELAKHLDDNTYLDSNAIRHYIKEKYKVEYKPSGIKDLLNRLGFVYKKPKHVPGKFDSEKQKTFVAEYEQLLKTKGKNDPIYFVDATHPQQNSIPAYGWIRRGKEKLLKSSGSRKRVNIHGAVNIHSSDMVVDFTQSVNKESSLRLFLDIEKRCPKAKKIHLFLDNASYYKAHWLRNELKLRKSKIVLHFLPPYSPNLNLIERLWKFFKKEVLYNTYYEKFEHFVEACKEFFRNQTKYKEKLRSILTEKFHLYENS
jgi:transposase